MSILHVTIWYDLDKKKQTFNQNILYEASIKPWEHRTKGDNQQNKKKDEFREPNISIINYLKRYSPEGNDQIGMSEQYKWDLSILVEMLD